MQCGVPKCPERSRHTIVVYILTKPYELERCDDHLAKNERELIPHR